MKFDIRFKKTQSKITQILGVKKKNTFMKERELKT